MTTTPRMVTVSSMSRIASTAAWSAAILSPRPIQRDANVAADSVTRTSSSARFLSGTSLTSSILHPLRSSTPTRSRQRAMTLWTARTNVEPERLLLRLEHAVLVVEAVEVVGDPDRVDRDRVRRAPRPPACHLRELEQPLASSRSSARARADGPAVAPAPGVAQDPGDPGVRVLHVVDPVLVRRSFARSTSRPIVWSCPRDTRYQRGVDTDRVDQTVDEHDVILAAWTSSSPRQPRQVDELVDEHLQRVTG